MAERPCAIEMRGITKTFGSVTANHNVHLDLRQGEILALLGENGSGKTTLMNMLSGIYQPDAGEILVEGKPVSINSPEDAKKLGIGMVHQHFKLVDVFTAADNIWMGKEKAGFTLKKDRCREIQDMVGRFGFALDPGKKVCNMAVSEKQTLEIIKVLYYGAKVIILDEPTAVLTVQEIEKLFAVLRRMRDEGHSIIIITHKLNEVMELSDRVAILRKGEYITTVDTAQTGEQELTEWMVGRKIDLNIDRPVVEKTRPLLEIRDLTIRNDEGAVAIDHVNFYIRGGEILGVAGIAGCGQKELCEAIAGLRPVQSGLMIHKGDNIVGLSPKAILEKGISMSFIPEDRLGMGLAPSLSITDNMILKNYALAKGPFVDRKGGRADAEHVIQELEVVTPSTEPPVRRQRAEGAAGPGDQGRAQRHRHRLSRAGAGHQLLLCHLSHPEPAEAERRGHPVRGRGPGRDAGIVRQDHGAVPRKGHGRGPRPQDHQGGAWPDDDRGAGPVKPL